MSTVCFVLVLLTVWVYLAAATVSAWRFARRPVAAPPRGPAVSILKPLHGAEPGLYENLRSFANQNYPEFQLVLGVRDHADSAVPIAEALIRDCPEHTIELVIDSRVGGSNLKVANLENMMAEARHDVIVLADSDMRVRPNYLATVTAPLADAATGLVTCLYSGAPADGLWSRLSALHINFTFLPGALVGDVIKVGGGCFGATIALRREVLAKIGGFARLRNELADDHRMGSAVRALGLKTVLSRYVVENRINEPSLVSLWRHELRWARTSRTVAPGGFAGSVVTHTIVLTTLAAAAFGSGPAAWGFVAISALLRWMSAAAIGRWLGLPRTGLWLLPLRDALSFAVFLGSFCGRNVSWRNQLFRVAPSGHMSLEGDKPA
jgi:ceramide glucosyltransferase